MESKSIFSASRGGLAPVVALEVAAAAAAAAAAPPPPPVLERVEDELLGPQLLIPLSLLLEDSELELVLKLTDVAAVVADVGVVAVVDGEDVVVVVFAPSMVVVVFVVVSVNVVLSAGAAGFLRTTLMVVALVAEAVDLVEVAEL